MMSEIKWEQIEAAQGNNVNADTRQELRHGSAEN